TVRDLTGPSEPRDSHSFPTRRSSDLIGKEPDDDGRIGTGRAAVARGAAGARVDPRRACLPGGHVAQHPVAAGVGQAAGKPGAARSEEHTSELQSRENLVCRLLLATNI